MTWMRRHLPLTSAPPTAAAVTAAVGIGVAALALAGGLLAPRAQRPSVVATVLHVAGGLAFVLVGAHAWRRRPDSLVGALMAAVGLTWFISDLRWTESSPGTTLAGLSDTVYMAVLGQLALAYPSGRLAGRRERLTTAAIYVWVVLSNFVTHVIVASPSECTCPHDLLVIHRDGQLHTLAAHLQNVGNILGVLVVLALVIHHWLTATRVGRRALDPVLWASGPIVLAVTALNAVNVIEPLHGVSSLLPLATPLALMTLPFTFLAGQLRSGLARLAVSRLVVELNRPLPPGRLRDILAEAFRDPTLEVALQLSDADAWVDTRGDPIHLPDDGGARVVTFLHAAGETAAALIHDSSLAEDRELMISVSAAARLAIENERLHAAVRAQLVEVRASRSRIVEAADAERRRLERDLHDGAQQRLVSLSLLLHRARTTADEAGNHQLRARLDDAAAELTLAQQELRELAAGIHPAVLTQGGLGAALEDLVERAPVPASLRISGGDGLAAAQQATAYFVVSEALANAGKHGGRCTVAVDVRRARRDLVVEVRDDGPGGANASAGSGLRGLADRLAALDGRLTVESPPGAGTRIVAEMPCE